MPGSAFRSWLPWSALTGGAVWHPQEVMEDPVMCTDGTTYERAAIKAWLEEKGAVSLLTGQALHGTVMVPNFGLRNVLQGMYKSP